MEILDSESLAVLAVVDYATAHGTGLPTKGFVKLAKSPKRVDTWRYFSASVRDEGHPEAVDTYLIKAGLVVDEGGSVRITDTGRMLLRSAREVTREEEPAATLVLDKGDTWAWHDVVDAAKGVGDYLLVDPYAKSPALADLARYTGLRRVLVGTRSTEDFAPLLGLSPSPGALEIRRGDGAHDRMIIPIAGPVLQLGGSFDRVGKKPSTLVKHSSDVSAALRHTYEEQWKVATIWA
jgi:hypothetical protein